MIKSVGMEVVHAFGNGRLVDQIQYVILKREAQNEIIIAFSGTENPVQLIKEAGDSIWVSYDLHPQTGPLVLGYFLHWYEEEFRDDFTTQLSKIVKEYPGYNFVFTGHSLGGALTVHAAADAILSNLIPEDAEIRIYDYGQPRVGNKEFLDLFTDRLTEFYRVVHHQDIVVHIPPCLIALFGGCAEGGILPYYPLHAPEEILYDKEFENYQECSLETGEDQKCSNTINPVSVGDHLYYYNFEIGAIFMQDNFELPTEDLIK